MLNAAGNSLSTFAAAGGTPSATGAAVDIIGTLVVRAHVMGIDLFSVDNPAAPTRLSMMGTGAVIRATSTRLERYPLPLVANAAPTGSTNGRVSTTGVGVVVVGTNAFRATNDRLEAYDLPGLGAPIADIGATVSAVGVGLAGR